MELQRIVAPDDEEVSPIIKAKILESLDVGVMTRRAKPHAHLQSPTTAQVAVIESLACAALSGNRGAPRQVERGDSARSQAQVTTIDFALSSHDGSVAGGWQSQPIEVACAFVQLTDDRALGLALQEYGRIQLRAKEQESALSGKVRAICPFPLMLVSSVTCWAPTAVFDVDTNVRWYAKR